MEVVCASPVSLGVALSCTCAVCRHPLTLPAHLAHLAHRLPLVAPVGLVALVALVALGALVLQKDQMEQV